MQLQQNSFWHQFVTTLMSIGLISMIATSCKSSQFTETSMTDSTTSEYADLGPQIRKIIESGYYAPQEFSQPRWKQFWVDVNTALATSDSDQELSRRFHGAAKSLGISHFSLYRHSNSNEDETSPDEMPQHVTLEIDENGIALLTVHGLFSVSRTIGPLTEAFEQVVSKQPNVLIIDLRQNRGGDVSSMLLAGHLISKPTPAGLFISRVWWESHEAVPARSNWDSLPHLMEPDLKAFFSALEEHGALVGVVPPMKPQYNGPVYVLTGPTTASASEPVVYLLKKTGRATIVGKPTAGAMLSSKTVELSDGWMLQYPVANYYTPQMTRIDQVGVTPDIIVPVENALDKTRKLIVE